MSVTNKHPSYDKYNKFWTRCRDIIEGEDRVKEQGELYLPKLSGQTSDEYKSYKDRALFYNAAARTVQALGGALFRRQPVIEPTLPYIESRAREVVEEVLSVGRCGILVDVPQAGGDPYFVVYQAEQIINWAYDEVNDVKNLTLAVIAEKFQEQKEGDEFSYVERTRYRVLDIDPAVGIYRVRLFEEREVEKPIVGPVVTGSSRVELVELPPVYPTMKGEALTFIPFQFFGSSTIDPDCDKPPLLDLINVNISHYRSSADLEHGRHFTALPTAWVAGFDPEIELRIGSGTAWVASNPAAHAGFLEFTGAGLGALEKALEQKEHLMAILGARLFEPPRLGVEAAETTRLRQSADTATAASIARQISDGLLRCYEWYLAFQRSLGATTLVEVELNTDILDTKLSPQEITSLLSLWNQGAISQDTFMWNLQQGEIMPPDTDLEIEKAKIDEDRFKSAQLMGLLTKTEIDASGTAP